MNWQEQHGAPSFDGCTYFPSARKTTDFGLALTADGAGLRIHNAIDRAGGPMVYVPFHRCSAELIFTEERYRHSFGSLIRLFPQGADFELRIGHFHLSELTDEFEKAVRIGVVPQGTKIAPPGNAGLSTGRHTHTEVVSLQERSTICDSLIHGTDSDITEQDVFAFAKHNHIPYDEAMRSFEAQYRAKRIHNLTRYTCTRIDYHTGELRRFYDSWHIFHKL